MDNKDTHGIAMHELRILVLGRLDEWWIIRR